MARVTIEDALKNCPNIFTLIQLTAKRAHQLQRGAIPKVDRKPNKKSPEDFPIVLALREIEAGFVDFENEIIPQKDMWGNEVVEQAPTPATVKHKAIVAGAKEEEGND